MTEGEKSCKTKEMAGGVFFAGAAKKQKGDVFVRLTFFGSSHGVPEPGRKCTCMLLEVRENCYFIDMGTPAIDGLTKRGISTDRVKSVFVTHMHGDHTNGLIPFVDLLNWYYQTSNGSIYLPSEEAGSAISGWLACNGEAALREGITFHTLKEGPVFDDGLLKVTAVKTQHTADSHAFLVQAEGKNLLFTGDLASPKKDFPQVVLEYPMDLIVCEGAHFSAMEYLPIFEKCGAKRYCITHYAPWNFPNMLELQKALPKEQLVFATDDMILEI